LSLQRVQSDGFIVRVIFRSAAIAAIISLSACKTAPPATLPAASISGYLCCNMNPNAEWISDINYNDGLYPVLAVGTPVSATEFGKSRVGLDVGGQTFWLGNDYSRNVPMDEFARRYIVAEDPRPALQAMSARDREAIANSRIAIGMTQQQVAMALGYPIDTADVRARATRWTYWTSLGVDYHVDFDGAGRVRDVVAGPAIKRSVLAD
jgi:hypothetical protein